MYLIKVELDRRDGRGLLADCQQMHRFITGIFGTDRKSGQIPYRTNPVRNKDTSASSRRRLSKQFRITHS